MEHKRNRRHGVLAAGLTLAALGAAAQGITLPATDAGLDCRQLRAELAALAAGAQGRQQLPAMPVGQAVPGAPGTQAVDAAQAQAQAAAVVRVAMLQAQAQQRGVAGPGRNPADAAGVRNLLGSSLSPAQAAQQVATPGHAAIQQLAGSRQEQLGGLALAKGCK